MSYKADFERDTGWSAVDLNTRLSSKDQAFIDFLKQNRVSTVIRYYAAASNSKILTRTEAEYLSGQGFSLLPVFQNKGNDVASFSRARGISDAQRALASAEEIGQPSGSTILFSADHDFSHSEIDGPIMDYFTAVKETIGSAFAMGAYGSGAVLAKLLHENLIAVPWLSMSRAFVGTQSFFYENRWALRQVPPEQTFNPGGKGYDKNILRLSPQQIGAFTLSTEGLGVLANGTMSPLSLSVPFLAPSTPEHRVVATDGLRLRDAPDGAVIRSLTIGEGVEDLGANKLAGWRNVKVGNDSGVVFGQYLRDQASPAVESLVQKAIAEWLRFDKGHGDEKLAPYYRYVREMWAAIGEPYDGRSRYDDGEEVPWSAAFISWVVRNAGTAYEHFKFSSSHSVFVNNAIKARYTQQKDKPFWGYRIDEQKPALGDIIQKNWPKKHYSFSWAENHADYNSHSDIVIEVKPDVVRVLGGNVSDSVNIKEYRLTSEGYLRDDLGLISILKNRADSVKGN